MFEAFNPKKSPALGSGKLVPNRRIGVMKSVDNQDMKNRYVEENLQEMMTEDRKKVRRKVSQMKQNLPGQENVLKINSQDELQINPEKPDLIGQGLK